MSGTSQEPWGRVAEDGTVYVRTASGERAVGSWQIGDPDGALAFYGRKYERLSVEIDLLASRLEGGILAPDDAEKAIRRERANVENAQAVGDLDALLRRLDKLAGLIEQRRAERREERKRQLDDAKQAKQTIAAEAETLAKGTDWRHGVGRFRELLDQWKALPRLDKATDDQLWRTFSTARTAYTRRRKQHFAELNARREDSRQIKEQLVKEADALADSTEWGRTAGRFRDLMAQWKNAGAAPRDVEDDLWRRFRAAQDRFFAARNEAMAAQDSEYQANLERKEALLVEAEALLPVRNHRTARDAYRRILERWDAIGRVPKTSVRSVEARLRKVDEAIKASEAGEWRRTNPETRARANATLTQLQDSISELEKDVEKARERGDARAERKAQEALDARRAWLAEVEKTLDEFAG